MTLLGAALDNILKEHVANATFFLDMAMLYTREETIAWIKSLPRKRKRFFTGSRYRAWVNGRRRWVYE